MQPHVSVIVPVYNAEKYLQEALLSITEQTLKNIEIIVVNDGSTDSSLQIVEFFQKKDSRIKLISQPKSNAGKARNAGYDIATGEYLSFLDSDDLFEPNMLECMYEEAKAFDADIIICNASVFDSLTGLSLPSDFIIRKEFIPDKDTFCPYDIPDNIYTFTYNVAWNKLFKSDFVKCHNIRFQSVYSNNDMLFVCSALVNAKCIRYLDKKLIHYRKNTQGQLSSPRSLFEENWPMLSAFEAVWNNIEKLAIFELVKQNFIDWSYDYLLAYAKRSTSEDIQKIMDIIKRNWLSKVGGTRTQYFSISDYLIFHELISPGYITGFFKSPFIPVPVNYTFQQNDLPEGARIILFGAGDVGLDLYLQIQMLKRYEIVLWADNNPEKPKRLGYPVMSMENLGSYDFDYILIAVLLKRMAREIAERLISDKKISSKRIIWAFGEL